MSTIKKIIAAAAVAILATPAEAGTQHAFSVKGIDDLSMWQVRKVTRALALAAKGIEWEGAMPQIVFTDGREIGMPPRSMARAVVYSSGREVIYIRRSVVKRARFSRSLALHEFSHLQAWRENGFDIEGHGPEFRSVCRRVALAKDCQAEGYYR